MNALARFGTPLQDISTEDFGVPDRVVQLGIVPNRIDLLTGITGVVFADAWPRRKNVILEGITVPILGREDLIRNKQATGRPQDRADLESLGVPDNPDR